MSDADLALRLVRTAPLISYDVETSGLDWRKNYIVGYVISDGVETAYVPVRHGGGGNIRGGVTYFESQSEVQQLDFERELAQAFSERNGMTVGHNIQFDMLFSLQVGVDIAARGKVSCTQVNEALINEYLTHYSLDACAKRHGVTQKLGDELYEILHRRFGGRRGKVTMSNFWRLAGNDPAAVDYAKGDGVTTIELYKSQRSELVKRCDLSTVRNGKRFKVKDAYRVETRARAWAVENALIPVLVRMTRRGIRVDLDYATQSVESIQDKISGIQNTLPEGFSPRSRKDLAKMVEDAQVDTSNAPRTKKGAISYNSDFLSSFKEGAEVVGLREWTNLVNTFFGPLVETHTHNGRVNPTWVQLKNSTGGTPARLACSGPNLQQVPKRVYDKAVLIRRAFRADDGYMLYDADHSQCEPRLFAHFARLKGLSSGYNKTPAVDAHTLVSELAGTSRSDAKTLNMSLFHGMGIDSLRTQFRKYGVELSSQEVGRMKRDWQRVMDSPNGYKSATGVEAFRRNASQTLLRRGFVCTLLGRRGNLEDPRYAYRATAKLIQYSNADIVKYMLVKMDALFQSLNDPLSGLFGTIHDAILWQVPQGKIGEDISREAIAIMQDVRKYPFYLSVPFVAECTRGTDWASATFGDNNDFT